jgi:hypothetical protein
MTSQLTQQHPTRTPETSSFTLNYAPLQELYAELHNPLSFWQELRITSMSGADYVFIPRFIYQAFGSSYPISRFMAELSCTFDLELARIQLICIDDQNNERQYSRTALEWSQNRVSHSHQEVVPANSQYTVFIESMYQYSSALVDQLNH